MDCQLSVAEVIPTEPPGVIAVLLAKGTVSVDVTGLKLAVQLPPHLVSHVR
ncbi:hypothetical protein LWC34_54535 [Kibdelosporangium philippinense]|uniref:Uncharacterized protein n=1 Tax=Kibdelosporangium philippinense TaxID=211113 RepID=A0ABS8ZVP5_9PSEU|nr:hypothetical protein [Kibdelosporangium philippinense]MCE7011777.1 hypothetical protein [Kibdelosporangium philippinense]